MQNSREFKVSVIARTGSYRLPFRPPCSADRRSQLRVRTCATRSFRNQPSNRLAFPHPQSRKDHYRNEDKPSCGCVVWNFVKRTIDVTEYGNRKEDMNPAKNGTSDASVDDVACIGRCGHDVAPLFLFSVLFLLNLQ